MEENSRTHIKEEKSVKEQNDSLMQEMEASNKKVPIKGVILIVVLTALLGIVTGYFVSGSNSGGSASGGSYEEETAGGVKKGEIYGSEDSSAFKDSAEGVLKEGGVDGEGKYHLERPGGESQNVYLISSTVDLGDFKGKKVKVWGETHQAQTAGWLMDVGRVEIL